VERRTSAPLSLTVVENWTGLPKGIP
jgi:hypothetical protein